MVCFFAPNTHSLTRSATAISICFSMADGFRPEVLAAFMQQIVDEPTLPNLFLRTVGGLSRMACAPHFLC